MSDWSEHAIWWHVYPLGFTGAPVRPTEEERAAVEAEPAHRLGHLTAWLDHVVELGTNGLLLGPIFAAETHGYDTTDFFRIDPRLGDESDLDDLVAECRSRGIRVLLDGVFNHVGRAHPLYEAALAAGEGSTEADLFRIDFSGDEPVAEDFEGHDALVELNHASPAVEDLVVEVMTHWLARGVDGWRLDAAYSVPNDFWARVLPRVREEFPDAWFIGEVIHGDYAEFVVEGTVDAVTQYELWKATWSSLKEGNFFELDWTLQRHDEFLDAFVPQTFIGNHDTTRIASQVGQDRAALAAVALLTVGGIPSIYGGDEYGWEGVKEERIGGDDEVRPIFPPTPEDPDELDPVHARMLRTHQELIALRRRHPWLTTARTETVELTNVRYVYEPVGAEGERLRVTLDIEGAPWAEIADASGEVLLVVGR
ncbi:alpha-amylase family protein [Georgenia sp. Z1344]|uniref:alpha-amylase family protein n=1 Tax=Georgenia sp. Z1344 TaxID=3416706 RepID=UPI003CE7DA46